jgi:acetyl-CoA carboxylase biotin carboxyl carrier protein
MDIEKIKQLIKLVEASGISELEISEGEGSVRISRAVATPATQHTYTLPVMPQPAQSNAVAPVVTTVAAESAAGTNQWSHRAFPNGRDLLSHAEPGCQSVL